MPRSRELIRELIDALHEELEVEDIEQNEHSVGQAAADTGDRMLNEPRTPVHSDMPTDGPITVEYGAATMV